MPAANETGYKSPLVSELAAAKKAAARMAQEIEAGKEEVAAARESAARMAQEMAAMKAELTGLKVHIMHSDVTNTLVGHWNLLCSVPYVYLNVLCAGSPPGTATNPICLRSSAHFD